MTNEQGHIVTCPTCKNEARYHSDNPHRPFCSERCRLIDLGEWADEGHRIPGQPIPPDYHDPESEAH
ncbi:MAG: DNA gyrase inhibitor YacG [Litorivicinaceae bacterium]|jgi:endogenous inhibitor of DNA gyrase (YacG/DUF329 family)|nr:DNA gyrase inhibitor YacG [Litorivicinus sp.]MDB2412271.1 DNA gyrase inhibitor YacG [Litorivicinaceae bacterium]MDF1782808.1 DNA gyrase inhibitor YacG [Litorivicinaceae bacterium]